jgi:hypothetical protein
VKKGSGTVAGTARRVLRTTVPDPFFNTLSSTREPIVKRIVCFLIVLCWGLLMHSPGQAGSKDGPRRWTKTVRKQSEVIYKIVFVAGKAKDNRDAEFCVIGDGGTDVDIEVYDEKGKLVVQDVGLTDLAFVRWQPDKTQEYTIKVKNLGNEDNTCHMGHN